MNSTELTAIMRNLSDLHKWELENSPFLNTMTGRHLYFQIAKRSVVDGGLLSRSLKELYTGTQLSEKALRMRVRDLERQGVIITVPGDDARARHLMPTEKFYEAIYHHSLEAKRIFSRDFLMIEKN